jgi:hypothetical protein
MLFAKNKIICAFLLFLFNCANFQKKKRRNNSLFGVINGCSLSSLSFLLFIHNSIYNGPSTPWASPHRLGLLSPVLHGLLFITNGPTRQM